MGSGYVLLSRKILQSKIWNDGEPFDRRSAWIYLILAVNHAPNEILVNGNTVKVNRGQLFTSVYKLANAWHWSRNRVYRFFQTLKNEKMVTTTKLYSGTLVTLANYDFYQCAKSASGTTDGTTNGTIDGAIGGTTDGTQTKNEKRMKKEIKEKASPEAPLIRRGITYE